MLAIALLTQTAAPPLPVGNMIETMPDDPVDIVDRMARERGDLTPVLILGTAHLSSLPDDFPAQRFDPLLDALEGWAPAAIAIEGIAGPQCDYLREYDPDSFATYCPDSAPARAALGLTGPAATQEAMQLLALPAGERGVEQRRRLTALFLAIGEPESALVQWLHLPAADREADDDLPAALVSILQSYEAKQGENIVIAVRLAVRLGLDRVHRVDDQASGNEPADPEAYRSEIMAIWDNPATRTRLALYEDWEAQLIDGSLPVLEWYRRLNSPESLALAMEGDFGAAAGARTPAGSGRSYVAYWETRNLRMAANIRQVIGANTRTLAIVGASHKPHYDRYLGMMSTIELADTQAVLRGD